MTVYLRRGGCDFLTQNAVALPVPHFKRNGIRLWVQIHHRSHAANANTSIDEIRNSDCCLESSMWYYGLVYGSMRLVNFLSARKIRFESKDRSMGVGRSNGGASFISSKKKSWVF